MAITNLTTAQRGSLVELYIAYFNRAPEAGGLTYWSNVLIAKLNGGQSELSAMTDISNSFYDAGVQYSDQTGYSATMTDAAFVTKIYENVLGRTGSFAPNASEVNYWVTAMNGTNPAETGVTRATVIQRMLSDAKAFANDPTWGWVTDLLNNKTEVANYFAQQSVSGDLSGADAVLAGKDILSGVTSNHASVTEAINSLKDGETFTLQEVMVEGEPGTPPVTAIYWGYTPEYSEVGEGYGVPVQAMLDFITTITGLDLHELGLIDDDGVGPFDNVTSLELEFETGDISAAGNATLIIGFADGTTANAEVALGEQYFFFLNNLLFDEDGNSRLYEKIIQEGSSGSEDHLVPIKLTPILNNGGTVETGYTTTGNDTIVAGRLDLLHGAYIDAGGGYNVLEIDAKGSFAQPLQLLNIQEIRVSDQPNFYSDDWYNGPGSHTYGDGYVGDSDYPDPSNTDNNDTWLDLSRATKIQKLVVTDQGSWNADNYSGDSDWENDSGDLTIVGVRNGALLRLEGAFISGDTNIHYGQGLTGTLRVELALGDVTEDINIIQNAAVMEINSTGIENHMHVFFAGGSLSRMIVKGTGAFGVDEDLNDSFNAGRPAIIDASANTGGLDVTLNDHYNVKIIGTTADDEITAQDSGRVVITANNGANLIDVDGSEIVDITTGTGNDTISAQDADEVVIVAGDGRNNINVDGSMSVDITTGSGNDLISANGDTYGSGFGTAVVTINSGAGNDTITATRNDVVTINAGDGANVITVSAHEASVTTGTGNDTVTISGMDTEFDNGDDENDGSGPGGFNGWNDDNFDINEHFADNIAPGVLMNLALGAGTNTVNLGRDVTDLDSNPDVDIEYGVTALEGSTLTGTGIKVFVENNSDITNLDITGATITAVVLKQELRLMLDQFVQIGAAKFSVKFDEEGATEDLYIVVTEDTDMSAMLDALPPSVRVHVELHNGATLTIDAEDLHTHFAWEGIDATDGLNGSIIINNAGMAFNPFSNGPNNQVIDGGTLSDDWASSMGVTINRSVTGFNRPTEDSNVDVTTIDTTGAATMTVVDPIVLGETGNPTVLEIIGNQDLVFAPGAYIDLGDGAAMGNTIDFSELDGTVTGMVIMNFDNLTGGIFGNNTNTRVEVGLGGSLGDATQGLISSGVETIVVTSIVDNDNDDFGVDTDSGDAGIDGDENTNTATIWLCDDSQDLQYIGMQGMYNKTLTISAVPWGLVHPTILMEGDGSVNWNDVLKANGSPETSNIGNIVVNYYTAGAPANILIRNEGGADLGVTSTGTERKFKVGTITVTNAASMNIDVEDGDATIAGIYEGNSGTGLKTLDIDATEDVTVTAALPITLTKIDASGVTGKFTATLDRDDDDMDATDYVDFAFIGAAGGSSLTFSDNFIADGPAMDGTTTSIDGGAAGVTLTLSAGVTVDLSEAVLTNVTKVTMGEGAHLDLTIAQMIDIGPENIVLGLGVGAASLGLAGLADEPFALADFVDGLTVTLVELADLPAITLNPATDLTGIGSLVVHEGTVLTLTAAQFQQLTGDGTIVGIDADGNPTTDFQVIITDFDQAAVEGGIDLSGIAADAVFVNVVGDVVLDENDDLGDNTDVTLPAGVTLSLYLEQADGLDITGDAILQFLDTSTGIFEQFDASGWSVDAVMLLNIAVANRNVDFVLAGIQEGVEKIIYNGVGMVDGVTQTVTITPETTVPGFLAFNPYEDGVEIENFILNLQGGTEISGDLILATTDKEDDEGNDLIRTYLKTVVINSGGTADDENIFTGDTANVIDGDITPFGFGPAAIANELLDVTINATQDFVVTGDIIFESEVGEDEFSGNDDDEAVAEVTVNGTADVEFGIDSDDDDVDGVVVTNNGTGTVLVGMDDGEIDSDDDLTFTGTGDIDLFIENSSFFDLSDDDLSAVDEVILEGNAEVTVTLAQYLAIGPENFIPDNDPLTTAVVNIVGVGSDPFDATGLNDGVVIGYIQTLPGDVVLDPTTNLTGVTMIIVPEGGSLTLTAEQYQQLAGSGTIVGVDSDGNPSSDYTVNITGLTQALVNYEAAYLADADGFDITGITANTKTITLGEAVVELTEADVELGDVSELEFILESGQELVFTESAQVSPTYDDTMSTPGSGVTVTGGVNTTATFFFSTLDGGGFDGDDALDASGINVATLKLLNSLVDNRDVELLQNIGEEVLVVIYSPVDNPGDVQGVDRVVIVEPDVTVAGFLVFNDYQPTQEIRTLDLTLQGDGPDVGTVGAVVDGNLRLTTTDKDPDLTQYFLDSVTIRSTGTGTNRINGDVSALVTVPNNVGGFQAIDNEFLNLNIVTATALVIDGDVEFNSLGDDGDDDTATFTASGTANITIDHLDISENDANNSTGSDGIGTLAIANNLTGGATLTVLGGTPAIISSGAFESLVITGTGNTVLGVDPAQNDEDGIDSSSLSEIDASGSSGALTIGTMVDIDSQNFVFTSGTGVTKVWLNDDELNENAASDTGWSFDFTNAAAGSELHLGSEIGWWEGTFEVLGSNVQVFIDNTSGNPTVNVDMTDQPEFEVMLNIPNATIVLGDGVTLTLTAAQANGLTIIAGEDTGGAGFTGVVNIIELEDDVVYDFGGIADEVAGTITLADNDVTVEPGTDLGDFSITLLDIGGTNASLAGQTIRFSTEEQATRDIIVTDTGGAGSSTNVVWLFDNIVAPDGIDTSGYSNLLGRLWFYADLVDNEGGDVEQLFTTLPFTILRIDIETLAELNILLQSQAVNRVMEIVHFVTVGDLTFSDMGVDPEEHLESLTLHVGGETTVGNIMVDDVVADPLNTDLSTIDFDFLTIVSHRAVRTGDLLASELFVNDNDGIVEPAGLGVEHVQPDNINTIGDIGVGNGNSGIDLVQVNIDTLGITTLDDSSAGDGAAIDIGIIEFGYTDQDGAGGDPSTTGVTLDVTGDNDINITQVDATDADITSVTVDSTGFTAVLTAPGASPGVVLGANVETLTFTNGSVESDGVAELTITGDGAEAGNESITVTYVLNGVVGSVTVDAGDVDLTDATAIAVIVANHIDALDGVSAANVGGVITVTEDTVGDSFAFAGVGAEGAGVTTLGGTIGDGTTEDGGTITLGSATNAGVTGEELSLIDADDFGGTLNLGVIAELDGTGTDGPDPGTAVDSLLDEPAFLFDSGTGLTTLTIDSVPGQGTPTLVAGSTWAFDMSDAAAGSTVTIGDGAVIEDGAFLVFANATVVIDGNVDLSDVNLSFDDSMGVEDSAIWIPAGSTLTLDVDQLYDTLGPLAALPANFRIYGSGTLHLIGDASNITLGAMLEVVNIDISDVTIITDNLDPDQDVDDTLVLDVSTLIAEDDDGLFAGYVIEGSIFNDSILASTQSDSVNGGDGDDTLFGGNPFLSFGDEDTLVGGSGTNFLIDSTGNTLFVSNDAGVDTANGIFNDVNTGDTITVAAGASIDAEIENDDPAFDGDPGFVATAATTNAGAAALTLENTGNDGTINMALAGGPNGYSITGQDNSSLGEDTLIGSAFADTIDGGNSVQTTAAARDVLTGNAGNDVFAFRVSTTSPATLAETVPTTQGVDEEVVTVTTADATDDDTEVLTINYTMNNLVNAVVISDAALGFDINFADPAAVANAIAFAFNNNVAGVTAGVAANVVTISGDTGNRFDVGPSTETTGADGLQVDETNGVDVAGIRTVTVTGTAAAGETYNLTVTLADGTVITADEYVAAGGETAAQIAAGMVLSFNNVAPASTVMAIDNFDGTFTLTDEVADNGSFTITTLSSSGAFGGSGASEAGAVDSTTADLITDFVSANDSIDFTPADPLLPGTFEGLAGNGSNYVEAVAAAANYGAALTAADTALNGTVLFYLGWIADDLDTVALNDQTGLLFFDANADGNVDGVIKLAGVTAANFDSADIIA